MIHIAVKHANVCALVCQMFQYLENTNAKCMQCAVVHTVLVYSLGFGGVSGQG